MIQMRTPTVDAEEQNIHDATTCYCLTSDCWHAEGTLHPPARSIALVRQEVKMCLVQVLPKSFQLQRHGHSFKLLSPLLADPIMLPN